MTRVRAHAPGRVNLIGDHTDYTGGLVLPMAIDRGTTVELERGGSWVRLRSDADPVPAVVPLDVGDPATVEPPWARYVAGAVAAVRPGAGGVGGVTTTLPVGAGLSSSAALEVALALALGFQGTPRELALTCQQAEQAASGVPCGVMDQLVVANGIPDHALLIDCESLEVTPVRLPAEVEVVVVDSGERRALGTSAYAVRRAECEAAARFLGPLRRASTDAVARLEDPVLRRRARHVVSENERVRATADALGHGDARTAGRLMLASHASLRDDFEVSTPSLDAIVTELALTPGVLGARLTGAGFGGCVVALVRAGSAVRGWRVAAAAGASCRAVP